MSKITKVQAHGKAKKKITSARQRQATLPLIARVDSIWQQSLPCPSSRSSGLSPAGQARNPTARLSAMNTGTICDSQSRPRQIRRHDNHGFAIILTQLLNVKKPTITATFWEMWGSLSIMLLFSPH